MLRRIKQPQPGTPGRTPSLFDKCTGFFYMRYTTHGTNGFTSHPKDEAMVKCLAQGHSVTAGDSNPHSADQKHQSLNSVLLTARPRHFHNAIIKKRPSFYELLLKQPSNNHLITKAHVFGNSRELMLF